MALRVPAKLHFTVFVGQIYCSFHRLPLTKTRAFLYTWRIFITALCIVTDCIIGVSWLSLILLFGLIDNSNHNTFLLSFDNFYFENVYFIKWYDLVKNKLSPLLFRINVLNSAVGTWCVFYYEFFSVRLFKLTNI